MPSRAHLLGHGVAQRLAHRHAYGLAGPLGLGGRRGAAGAGGAACFASAGLAAAGASRPSAAARPAARGAARRRLGGIVDALAFGGEDRDRRVDRDAFGAFLDQDLARRCLRRPPRPPWSPCRSRSRRSPDPTSPRRRPSRATWPACPRSWSARGRASEPESTSIRPRPGRRSRARTDRARDCAARTPPRR